MEIYRTMRWFYMKIISTQQLDRTDEGRTHDGQPRYSTVHDL
jgi:hypothetical protein